MKVYGLLILLCCLVLFPIVGTAQLYQWTDASGNVHITDTPPPTSEKKPASPALSASQTSPAAPLAPQKKTSARRQASAGQVQAEVRPLAKTNPTPTPAPQSSHNARSHSLVGGLNQAQAMVTSPWQVFEGNPASTKAAVRRWTDEQGIDHFVDALPDARRHPGSS
jgi:hypothetical protein